MSSVLCSTKQKYYRQASGYLTTIFSCQYPHTVFPNIGTSVIKKHKKADNINNICLMYLY